jgi:hypothetical protein
VEKVPTDHVCEDHRYDDEKQSSAQIFEAAAKQN